MIKPVGFYPVSFEGKHRKDLMGMPKGIRPLKQEDPTLKMRSTKCSQLYQEIHNLDEQIFKLESECARAKSKDFGYDDTATLRKIGRLINRKIALQNQIQQEIEAILAKNSQ